MNAKQWYQRSERKAPLKWRDKKERREENTLYVSLLSFSPSSLLRLCSEDKRKGRKFVSFSIHRPRKPCFSGFRFICFADFLFSAKMMVANSFDLWQKDQFFSAAEEVQESADTMESAYRRWLRERRGLGPDELDELCSELQTALGTAKWQLEEFERAVRLSYGHRSHRCEDSATARHRQFIDAIENQISRVETSLRESFSEQGKQPFRWVNLDEEERDDLAAFLSGAPQCLKTGRGETLELRPSVRGSTWENHHKGKEVELDLNAACSRNTSDDMNCLKDVNDTDKVAEHIIEIEPNGMSETRENMICQVDRTMGARKTWGSPKFSDLKIVVADEDVEKNKLTRSIEATPKEKGYKPVFWKLRCSEHPQAKRGIPVFNQLFGRVGGSQRQSYSPRLLQFGCSVQFALVLMLTIFLIVPFVFYSN